MIVQPSLQTQHRNLAWVFLEHFFFVEAPLLVPFEKFAKEFLTGGGLLGSLPISLRKN